MSKSPQRYRVADTKIPRAVLPWQGEAQTLLRQGRFRDAEAVLTHVIVDNPKNHAALHLLGAAARDGGNLPRALSLMKQAIALDGTVLAYHVDLAFTYLTGGRFEEAAASYHRALALDPTAHLARFGLGMAFLAQREFAAAASQLTQYTAAVPSDPDGHLQLGIALIELGQAEQAVAHLNRALALRPTHAPTHLRYGIALGANGRPDLALRHLHRALALDPNLTEAHDRIAALQAPPAARFMRELTPEMMPALYKMAEHAILRGRFDEAGWCYDRALTLDADIPAPYQGLAQVHFMEGRCDQARRFTLEAEARGADPASTQTMLGQIAEAEGDFPAAIAAFERAIALRPTEAMAQLKLAMLRKPTDIAAHIAELERLRTLPTLDTHQQATLSFALGRTYDQLGDADAAFAYYKAGNDARLAQCTPYDDASFAVDQWISVFTPEFLRSRAGLGHPSRRPVFVVGMMRSGTTLVEQILASHPKVHGHSELTDIRRISQAMPAATGGSLPYPDCVTLLDAATADRFARAYLARLERDAPDAARSIDKMPQNFHYLGLIALLFPNARIIHCTRDPIDTCLSNYCHDFGPVNAHTYDLATLGGYFAKYRRLMEHWEAVIPDSILTIPYEGMVADQEGWSRKAIDFLGLDWDPACLAFHSNERSVNTFSVWQVRQPIYTTAINRWERYRRHLGPLFEALGTPPGANGG
jgi:tetratricopeptide (TPR) repeat protein